ncbi:MAG: hypothetical protein MRZ79_03965 [Bacteroidia bacterium]|nr:hypothetical protein [Bacteroidia bacterium]
MYKPTQYLTKLLLFILIAVLFLGSAQGQELRTRPFQISLIHPISTSGLKSGQFNHAISFNMIAGYSGGLTGIEFGGFANIIRYDMYGAQFAGFANIVGRSSKGFQAAGFMNVSGKEMTGAQFAGFANISGSDANGTQFAGFANISSRNSRGLKVAGFANIASGNVKGAQIAGFANFAPGNFKGIQMAGFLNVAKKMNGLQIGVVNYADSIDRGMMIGLFNFARRGGTKQIDFGYNDAGLYNLSLRMGSRHLYNIYSVGYAPEQGFLPNGEQTPWAVGLGFGSNIKLIRILNLNLEAVAYHLNEERVWDTNLNELYRGQANLELKLARGLSIYGGPALNFRLTDQVEDPTVFGADWSQGNIRDRVYAGNGDGFRLIIRQGLQFGVRLGLTGHEKARKKEKVIPIRTFDESKAY